VTGLSLAPETVPNLFSLLSPYSNQTSVIGDIRNRDLVERVIVSSDPTIAIHMAAQPLVRRSYREPVETFETNVQGTINILNGLRHAAPHLKAVLVVTTDKVYQNLEDGRAFLESDPLGGHDPYSASKAATEIAVASWAHSYFRPKGVAIASARAGNVIGGGDWSEDRLIPDVWRAARIGKPVELRYPEATRPWQHVLDPLNGYLVYAEALAATGVANPAALNFGPDLGDEITVAALADIFAQAMGLSKGWVRAEGTFEPEMKLLGLDARAARKAINWVPRLNSRRALDWTAEWYKSFDAGIDIRSASLRQVENFEAMGAAASALPI
jgi:CDP-glucose 4,6-dehydratase